MQERYIATADLGSSKIALCVARVIDEDVQVIYYRQTPSDGIRYGSVFNPKRASIALGNAISNAEEELHIKILQVVVGLPRYGVRQENGTAQLTRTDPRTCISQEEIDALKATAIQSYPLSEEDREEIYGAVAQSFSVEDLFNASENDVVGATSELMNGNFKIFVGARKPVENIDSLFNELGVAPAIKCFTPISTAEAVLKESEKENGVALIEMGAGVTSLTIYRGGILRYYGSIPFGGKTITTDIKHECAFTERLAENIKLAFGACMPEKLQSMSEKIIQIDDEEVGSYEQLPVKYLSEIITCRVHEIMEAILFLIQESGYADKLRSGVVITGGCADLANLGNMIKEQSGYNYRIGYPNTRDFSCDGCGEIKECGAVASVGMLLEARKDRYLNCVDKPEPVESEVEVVEEEPVIAPGEEAVKDTVFDKGSFEEVKPPKVKKVKETGRKKDFGEVKWFKQLNQKVGELFDNTIGSLYDSAGENNEQ